MNRFLVAAALAVAIGLGTSSKASAQIVYGYSMPAGGGVVSGGTVITPNVAQSTQTFVSPLTGVVQKQTVYTDIFGNSMGRTTTYNPWLGLTYRSGFVQPNPLINPFGGYNYGFIRRW
jgi:hypothetical protein